MLANGDTGEILFFKMRDDVFYPTLKLLHKCMYNIYLFIFRDHWLVCIS